MSNDESIVLEDELAMLEQRQQEEQQYVELFCPELLHSNEFVLAAARRVLKEFDNKYF